MESNNFMTVDKTFNFEFTLLKTFLQVLSACNDRVYLHVCFDQLYIIVFGVHVPRSVETWIRTETVVLYKLNFICVR